MTEYSYLPGGDAAKTTALVQTLKSGGDTYIYTYDELGNITTVSVNGTLRESYTCDALGQLTGAVMGEDTYAYTYDAGGNLTARTKNGESVAVYGYDNEHWADLLTSYNGVSIAYDGIGNPLHWKNGETFTWSNGRQLTGITTEGGSITYTYDESGQRTSKDVNGEKTDYYWLNGQLLGQKSENEAISFLYDETGSAFGMIYNGVYYYYEFNLQGDIIGIIDSTGTRVVEYDYGVWGEMVSVTGTLADTVGQKNPLRYRGYYYDSETGFYYLTSRYYDPEVGRFINADDTDILEVQEDLYDKNLYAYCDNNPISRVDKEGDIWELAVAGGGTFAAGSGFSVSALGGSILAGLGAITPVGWIVIGTVVVTSAVVIGVQYAKSTSKGKSKEEVDPYARQDQKKQGRENKNRSRQKDSFKSRNNRRDNKPAKPKKHTPSRKGHTKYYIK